ncbi:hypothetical protein Slin15195_G120920 [Septoria linicola]|uniref:Uncharacterized protein n=1 Tax=Septoria linicola TaxID=215465 RepID=A0A9Q9ERP7_9PEZI|nr:hypothetical protein Slin15195_G120920 [Septoria linicola]
MPLPKQQQLLKDQLDMRAMAHVVQLVDDHKDQYDDIDTRRKALGKLANSHGLRGLGFPWGSNKPWAHDGKTLLSMVSADLCKVGRLAVPNAKQQSKAQALDAFFQKGSEFLSEEYRAELERLFAAEEAPDEDSNPQMDNDGLPVSETPPDDEETYSDLAPHAGDESAPKDHSATRSARRPRSGRAHSKVKAEQVSSEEASSNDLKSELDAADTQDGRGYEEESAARMSTVADAAAPQSPTAEEIEPAIKQERQSLEGLPVASDDGKPTTRSRKRKQDPEHVEVEDEERPRTVKRAKTPRKLRDAQPQLSARNHMVQESDVPEEDFQAETHGTSQAPWHGHKDVQGNIDEWLAQQLQEEEDGGVVLQSDSGLVPQPLQVVDEAVKRASHLSRQPNISSAQAPSPDGLSTNAAIPAADAANGIHATAIDGPRVPANPSIMKLCLEDAVREVDECIQRAVQALGLGEHNHQIATVTTQPSRSLTRLYTATLGKQWLILTSLASSGEFFDEQEETGVRFNTSTLLRSLIWHYLTSGVLSKDSLEGTVYAMLNKSKPHLQPVLHDEGVSFDAVLRRASTAQFEDDAYAGDVLAQCAQDHASKLMIILRQHLNEIQPASMPQNWRMEFMRGLNQMCRQALMLRARLEIEEVKHEVCTFGYPAVFDSERMDCNEGLEGKVLLTLVPGIKKLTGDGLDGAMVVTPVVVVCDIELPGASAA